MGTRKKKKREGWMGRFLEALTETGNVRFACQQAGIGRTTAYKHRDSDKDFATEWDDAVEESHDILDLEARRRAVQGTERIRAIRTGTDKHGRPIYERISEREYSDLLLIFMLKAKRPEEFRDNYDWREIFAGITAAQAQAIADSGAEARPEKGQRGPKR